MKKILLIGLLCSAIFLLGIANVFAEPADINGDGKADLSDLILTLKTLSDIAMTQVIDLSADVNGDNRIGLQEAAYLLNMMSATATDEKQDHEDAEDYVWDCSGVIRRRPLSCNQDI